MRGPLNTKNINIKIIHPRNKSVRIFLFVSLRCQLVMCPFQNGSNWDAISSFFRDVETPASTLWKIS